MSLHYNFTPDKPRPKIPDILAHTANDQAIRAVDAKQSKQAFEAKVRQELNHPLNQKIVEATRSRKIIIYAVFALAFFVIILWEWAISHEIYAILLPQAPWLPFLCCVCVAFYASVCLGETSSHFVLLNLGEVGASINNDVTQSARSQMYNQAPQRQKSTSQWILHPLTGTLLGLCFLFGIYLVSRQRVALLEAAGEVPGASFHVYLPVILYAIDILLGIPGFFVVVWLWSVIRNRQLTDELTKVRDFEITFRRSCIQIYTQYLSQFELYNRWAENNNELPRQPIAPCQELRQILIDEFGYDPIVEQGFAEDSAPSINSPSSANSEQEDSGRVNDLMNLVDQSIDSANRGL